MKRHHSSTVRQNTLVIYSLFNQIWMWKMRNHLCSRWSLKSCVQPSSSFLITR
ncbi:unnamed protein product [Trichobilharzia regenti]|nr:unnamed protein product [Trichobilharzia regenti]